MPQPDPFGVLLGNSRHKIAGVLRLHRIHALMMAQLSPGPLQPSQGSGSVPGGPEA